MSLVLVEWLELLLQNIGENETFNLHFSNDLLATRKNMKKVQKLKNLTGIDFMR
jgi:hypothetical protein